MNIFINGFMHPFLGIDHIIMMIAVGAWAVQLGGKARWIVPAAFVTIMALSGIIGMQTGSLTYIETGITASVIAIGILIAMAIRLPVTMSALLVGVFAFFHGHAHGSEMIVGMSGAEYIIGFMIATICLLVIGMVLARSLQSVRMMRLGGAGMAFVGLAALLLV